MSNLFFILAVTICPLIVMAEVSELQWPIIQKSQYGSRTIQPTTLIQLKAPLGAENAAQVPLTLTVNNQAADPIVSITLLVDANPFPFVAKYTLPLAFKQLELSTRLRIESDSHIRAIAETKSGALLMATTVVNAGGGCAGAVADDEASVRLRAGEIKFQHNAPFKFNEIASATLQIRHPMYTGLQLDTQTKQIKPPFFIEQAAIYLHEEKILDVVFGVGTAENPYLKFNFDLPKIFQAYDAPQILIQTKDNEGKQVSRQF